MLNTSILMEVKTHCLLSIIMYFLLHNTSMLAVCLFTGYEVCVPFKLNTRKRYYI